MKQLLVEEMKRAIQLMEEREELNRWVDNEEFYYYKDDAHYILKHDRGIPELISLFKAIRKHSVILEKGIE